MTKFAITGARIFDGATWHDRSALVINGGVVEGLMAADSPSDAIRIPAEGAMIVPGFVDLQVNGGGGALFNPLSIPYAACALSNPKSYNAVSTVFLAALVFFKVAVSLSRRCVARRTVSGPPL